MAYPIESARSTLAATTQAAKRKNMMRNKPGGGAKRLSTTKNLAGMRPRPKHYRREG